MQRLAPDAEPPAGAQIGGVFEHGQMPRPRAGVAVLLGDDSLKLFRQQARNRCAASGSNRLDLAQHAAGKRERDILCFHVHLRDQYNTVHVFS